MAAGTLSGSAQRYADAAFAVARDQNALDPWQQGLDEVASLLSRPDVATALTSPAVPETQKRAALDQLAPGLPPLLRNLLHLLIERSRLAEVPNVAAAFRYLVNEERGLVTAEVTTAIPLDAELQRQVAQRLGAYLQHDPQKLVIESRVDPRIIGGVVARVGDTLIDDSVRGRIERLRRALTT